MKDSTICHILNEVHMRVQPGRVFAVARMTSARSFLLCLVLTSLCFNAGAAEPEPFVEGWPRLFEFKGSEVVVYQPQLTEWDDHKTLHGQAAVAVTLKGQAIKLFGAVTLEADTEVDFTDRMVVMKSLRLTNLAFPNMKSTVSRRCRIAVEGALPKDKVLLISLDRVLAGMDRSQQETRITTVNLDPPPIFYSNKPAILVLFMGEPKLEPVAGVPGLLYAVNTNWDIILELGSSRYYLLNEESWLVTDNVLEGPWQPAGQLPEAFSRLPAGEHWAAVKKAIPGKRVSAVPTVFVSQEPAELILTEGIPSYAPIRGTKLLYATNTESDLFLHTEDGQVYFLTAGRWFKAKTLAGSWASASENLPADFSKIPASHDEGSVLSVVPGTPEADAAVVLASIPHKAMVNRQDTTVTVVYEGTPEFVEIAGTESAVQYAVNTPYSIFRVNQRYYCCHNGVWFEASGSAGPWIVCDEVPAVLYTIPADHPMHNVTYVYVYSSSPDVVVVGYTVGYSGYYVAPTGVIMFGLGYWANFNSSYAYYHYYHWYAYYYSYGCAARYDYHHGGYYRSARYYGPRGGIGGAVAYDPRRGTYYRGGYAKGPYGGAFVREAYNPYTDRYGVQARVSTPYQSWGRTVVADGDDWARGGHRSRGNRTVGAVTTSSGAAVVGRYNSRTDQGVVVGRDRYGDVYAARDGNVYRRQGESWEKKTDTGWDRVDTTRERSNMEAWPSQQPTQGRIDSRRITTTNARRVGVPLSTDLNRSFQSRQRGIAMRQRSINRGSVGRGASGRGAVRRR